MKQETSFITKIKFVTNTPLTFFKKHLFEQTIGVKNLPPLKEQLFEGTLLLLSVIKTGDEESRKCRCDCLTNDQLVKTIQFFFLIPFSLSRLKKKKKRMCVRKCTIELLSDLGAG